MGRGSCVYINLFSSCLISYSVILQQQYEIIIIPTLLVAVFLILLGVILWLFIKGKRSQQQSSGLQGKAKTGGLDIGSGKMEMA